MIHLFHLQKPLLIQSDNYETNAPDPRCLSGNVHWRPAETQRRGRGGSNLHVSTGPEGEGTEGMRDMGVGGGVLRGLGISPSLPRETSCSTDHSSRTHWLSD